MRLAERITAAAIMLIAAVAMADSFRRSGWTASGPDAGFYPFWSAAAMGAAGAIVLVRSPAAPAGGRVFSSREGVRAILQLLAPLLVGVVLLSWLGFYLVSGLYMGFFARWLGRYHWIGALALAVVVPIALYLTFERGFKVPLPKSLLYTEGIVPF